MELSVPSFTVEATPSLLDDGSDTHCENKKRSSELASMDVDVKRNAGMGGSAKNTAKDSVKNTTKDNVDAFCVDVFVSSDVVQSIHDKVIAGYWLVKAVLDVSITRGANKNKLFRGTGIFEDTLQPNSLISIKQYQSLLANVQSQTKGADVSFLLGNALASQWLRSPLHVLQTCDTLQELLTHLVQHQAFRWSSMPLCQYQRFDIHGKIILVPLFTPANVKMAQFVSEIGFATLIALLKGIGKQRVPASFSFTCPRPKNIADFETHLGLKLTFNCPVSSISFEKSALHESLSASINSASDMTNEPALATHAGLTLSPLISLPDYVRSHVYQSIRSGHSGSALPELAEKLTISPATLKRKLKEFNTSYRQLSEEVWRNYALILLSVYKANNEEAASKMGINDLPNFRRTIKRLTGKTPSELRLLNT